MATSESEYDIPLADQRIFGAGLKRKRIHFVPSQSESPAITSSSTSSAADKYLSIVFNKTAQDSSDAGKSSPPAAETVDRRSICNICRHEISVRDTTVPHESNIAHQICLQHSFPPSNIDRSRKGLTVLQTQGWDPDARRGLGSQGEGRLYPVKAKENPSRAGLGAELEQMKAVVEKPLKLDARKVRTLEKETRKKAESLRNAFYRSEQVERYLERDQTNETLDLVAFKRSKRKK